MRKAWLLCVFVLFPACFLDQKEPTSGVQPGPTPYVGIAVIEDVSGYAEQAVFYAGITKREENPAISRRSHRIANFQSGRDSAPVCQYGQGQYTTGSTSKTYLNVGTLGIGPALQSSVEAVSPNEKGIYELSMAPNLPGTIYQFMITGRDDIKQFADYISLPEDIGFPIANKIRFEDGLPLIQGTGITLEWDRPAVANDQSILYVDFLAEVGNDWYLLQCGAYESAFGVQNPRLTWELPQVELAKFPVTGAARLTFTRAHKREVASDQLEMSLQGLRTAMMQAVVFTP